LLKIEKKKEISKMIKWRFRPRKKKKEFEEIEYTPTSVKDLLTEMKDISELIVDLAYSAVIFDCEDMAKEVEDLEIKMDKLLYQIRLAAMMATRTAEDAEQLSGILQVATMAENISNAAGDIVKLLDLDLEARLILPMVLRKGDEKIRHVFVDKSSTIVNRQIGDLLVESETGARVIAVNRGKHWIYGVDKIFKFKANDRLIVRGVKDGLDAFVRYASGAEPWPKNEVTRSGKLKRGGAC
jgi:uncharacterized protein with PhoU and TrkA domain